jgi:hypothetical protein
LFTLANLDKPIPDEICDIILNEENWKGEISIIKQAVKEFYDLGQNFHIQVSKCI